MATKNWKTSADGIWNVVSNWADNSAPAAGDDVSLAALGNHVVTLVKGTYSLNSLTMGGSGTLTMNSSTMSTATVGLSNGTLKGGVLTVTGSMSASGLSGNAVLDGMTVNGQVAVGSGTQSRYLTLRNGLTMGGDITLTNGSLLIDGAQTIGGAAITVANSGTSEIASAGASASQATLSGGSLEVGGRLNAASVAFNEAVHVSGTGYLNLIGANAPTTFGASARIAVDAGGKVLLSQNITSDALTDFASKVTAASGATVTLSGSIDNTGRTLDLSSASKLASTVTTTGNTIIGGTVVNAGPAASLNAGALYGVALRGLFRADSSFITTLTVRDSLSVLNTDGSAGTLDLANAGTTLVVDTIGGSNAGIFTLSNMTLRAAGISASTATVLDASFTANFAASGGIGGTVVNKGTVIAAAGVALDLGYASTGLTAASADSFENDATVAVFAGAKLNAAAGFVNKGVVRLADGASAQFASTSLGTISVEGANTNMTFLTKGAAGSLVGLNSDDRLFLQTGGAGTAAATVSGRILTLSEDGAAVATFDLGQDGWNTSEFATSISGGIVTVSNTHGAAATTPVVTTPTDNTGSTGTNTGGTVTSNGYTLHDRPTAVDTGSASYRADNRPDLGFVNSTTGQQGVTKFDVPAPGGPDNVKWAFIMNGYDKMAIATDAAGVFIHAGTGTDAIAVKNGDNVLDGGTGSNFLYGGTGNDTFFTDVRPAEVTWSTLVNFHAGDQATIWGFKEGVSTMRWSYYDATGRDGVSGASLDINVDGGAGRNGSGLDARVTFAGLSVQQASSMLHSTGNINGGEGAYLHFYNQGV